MHASVCPAPCSGSHSPSHGSSGAQSYDVGWNGSTQVEPCSQKHAPSTTIEKALTLLWEKTLGISPVGVDDDFVDLGGDSIEAIQIQHAIRRDFDTRIKNTEFLAEPTIAALAALIAARTGPTVVVA